MRKKLFGKGGPLDTAARNLHKKTEHIVAKGGPLDTAARNFHEEAEKAVAKGGPLDTAKRNLHKEAEKAAEALADALKPEDASETQQHEEIDALRLEDTSVSQDVMHQTELAGEIS